MNQFMIEAIKQAQKAYKKGEVPVGAVIVKNNKIISRAYNKIEKTKSATKHAEIIAIEKASKKLKNWRLNDCEIYVTLKPCEMCMGAIKNSRIKKVYYALDKIENKNFKYNECLIEDYSYDVQNLLQKFFKQKRK